MGGGCPCPPPLRLVSAWGLGCEIAPTLSQFRIWLPHVFITQIIYSSKRTPFSNQNNRKIRFLYNTINTLCPFKSRAVWKSIKTPLTAFVYKSSSLDNFSKLNAIKGRGSDCAPPPHPRIFFNKPQNLFEYKFNTLSQHFNSINNCFIHFTIIIKLGIILWYFFFIVLLSVRLSM